MDDPRLNDSEKPKKHQRMSPGNKGETQPKNSKMFKLIKQSEAKKLKKIPAQFLIHRSAKKSLIVQSVNNIHKNSQNTLPDKYLSTQFHGSSGNISNGQLNLPESSHKKHASEVSMTQKIPNIREHSKANLLLSQNYLDVKVNSEYLELRQKRVKSQMQMQTPNDAINFTSINRTDKETRLDDNLHPSQQYYEEEKGEESKFKSIQSYYDYKSSGSKRGTQPENELEVEQGRDLAGGIQVQYRRKHSDFDEDRYLDSDFRNDQFKMDKSLEHEEFFHEQSGNIYCKRVEDVCADCLHILGLIKKECGLCQAKQEQNDRESLDSGDPSGRSPSETCMNCWNTLSNYTERCLKCNDEVENRPRNITFANKIIIKKKSKTNEIGITLVDFDDKLSLESNSGLQGDLFQKKRPQHSGGDSSDFKSERDKGPRDLQQWKVTTESNSRRSFSGQKKDLQIHIPGQDFSMEQSEVKNIEIKKHLNFHSYSNSGEQTVQSHFDYRDPYMIRPNPKDSQTLLRSQESPMNNSRPKAISYNLELNWPKNANPSFQNRKITNNKSKETNKMTSKLGKKISFLKSKKNSIKRDDVLQSKVKKDYKGFQKKMKMRLDISQKLRGFGNESDNEPIALKSCSMKNTITKFKFDYPSMGIRNFEIKPKFSKNNTKAMNDSRREKSINLIYNGKSKLKRNHTTKLLRNISYYQDTHFEAKYAAKKSKN